MRINTERLKRINKYNFNVGHPVVIIQGWVRVGVHRAPSSRIIALCVIINIFVSEGILWKNDQENLFY